MAARGSPVAVGTRPNDVVLADVNNDGHLDLLTANSGCDDVSVLLGNGDGSFRTAPGSPFRACPAPHLVAAGDLNSDGNRDLAVSSHDSNHVCVFFGRGDGTFAIRPNQRVLALDVDPPHNHGLSLSDVDADGHLDISTANQNHNSASVLLGDGGGSFRSAPGSPFAVGRQPYNHALADVNSDGKPDIVVPNVGDDTISILLGDGSGGFGSADGSPLGVAHRPYALAVGDVNGDGHADLIASHDDATLISVLLGDGRGGFIPAPGSPLNIGRRAVRLQLADLNGDGVADLAAGAAGNVVVVLFGNGRGGFSPAPGSPLPAGRGSWSVALGDLNGDGKLDIVAPNFESNNVSIFLAR